MPSAYRDLREDGDQDATDQTDMKVKKAEEFWGDCILNKFDMVLKVVEDAIYIPFSPKLFFDRNPDWGIYTREGDLVQEAAYIRGPQQLLVGQTCRRDLSRVDCDDTVFDEMIYAGPIIPHFGHFLVTSLARLWALNGKTPALFHSDPPLFTHGLPYLHEIFAAAGLNPSNAFSFTSPTRIRRLFVPQASFVEQFYVSPCFSEPLRDVSRAFRTSSSPENPFIYLSKGKLNHGVARLKGEEVIEQRFSERGYAIVYPEELSIPQQVSMFKNAQVIVGTASSAFHSMVLTPDSESMRVVFHPDVINSNFALVDRISGGETLHYTLRDALRRSDSRGFMTAWEADDIEQLASDMVGVVPKSGASK